eukprot:314223-Pyramimonas_sp.AAC.1
MPELKVPCALDFPNKDVADFCWRHFKGISMKSVDPRSQVSHDLRLGKGQPLPVRHKAYAFGIAYNITLTEMKENSCGTRPP